jgi:hypothetical protein
MEKINEISKILKQEEIQKTALIIIDVQNGIFFFLLNLI